MKLFFDGGSRPLPVGMELAVVVGGRSHVQRGLGPGTSMDAEWLALIEAMQCAHALGVTDAVLLGDAAAVIAQANGLVRCPPSCLRHFERFQQMPRPEGRRAGPASGTSSEARTWPASHWRRCTRADAARSALPARQSLTNAEHDGPAPLLALGARRIA